MSARQSNRATTPLMGLSMMKTAKGFPYIYGAPEEPAPDTSIPSQSIVIYRLQDSEDDITVWELQTEQNETFEPYEIRIYDGKAK